MIAAAALFSCLTLGASARSVELPAESVGRAYSRPSSWSGTIEPDAWWGEMTASDARDSDGGAHWSVVGPAKGTIEVPDGNDLMIRVDPEASADLSWLKAMDAGAIQALDFTETDVTDDSIAMLASLDGLRELFLASTDLSDAGLEHVKALAGLKALDLSQTFVTDDGLASLSGLGELQSLVLSGTEIAGAGLAHLTGLPKLVHLALSNTNIDDDTIGGIEAFTGLKRLDLSATPATNDGIVSLAKLTGLEDLSLGGENSQGLYFEPLLDNGAIEPLLALESLRSLSIVAGINNRGLEQLATIESLERIIITGAKYDDEGLAHLAGHPNLKSLFFISPSESRTTVAITGEGVAHLAKISGLQGLGFENTDVDDDALKHLRGMESIEVLNLDSPGITDAALDHVQTLTSLKSLHLPYSITDDGLAKLSSLESLRRLRVPFSTISDAGVAHLAGLKGLEELDLYGTRVTNAAAEHLIKMTSLRVLIVGYSDIDEETAAKIAEALPLCDVQNF